MEILTSWEKDGIKKGMQQGLEQGREQGRIEGASMLVFKLLNRRFGNLDQSITERVKVLPLEMLEELAVDLLDFKTVDDLEPWLSERVD